MQRLTKNFTSKWSNCEMKTRVSSNCTVFCYEVLTNLIRKTKLGFFHYCLLLTLHVLRNELVCRRSARKMQELRDLHWPTDDSHFDNVSGNTVRRPLALPRSISTLREWNTTVVGATCVSCAPALQDCLVIVCRLIKSCTCYHMNSLLVFPYVCYSHLSSRRIINCTSRGSAPKPSLVMCILRLLLILLSVVMSCTYALSNDTRTCAFLCVCNYCSIVIIALFCVVPIIPHAWCNVCTGVCLARIIFMLICMWGI